MRLKLILVCSFFSLQSQEQPTPLLKNSDTIIKYAHGLGRNKDDIQLYHNDTFPMSVESFNFPEAIGKQTGVGHGPDLAIVADEFKSNNNYIAYGFSRGGAALLKFIGENNPNNIKALILEGAPADVVDLVRDVQLKTAGIDLIPHRNLHEIIFHTIYPQYPLHTTPAIESIKNLQNKNLPILIFHSKTDKRVPISSAWNIYLTLKKMNCPNVYLHEIESGEHATTFRKDVTKIMEKHYRTIPDEQFFIDSQKKALRSLHLFYKTHNFPYREELCSYESPEESQPFSLAKLQPTVEEILKKIDNEEQLQHQLEKKTLEKIALTSFAAYFALQSFYDNLH